ncbi:MAG: ArsR/SmtB family transcription factor [Sedimentibacter sp.]
MEEKDFEENYKVMKALSDINRMKILNILTNGEMCACKILEEFNIKQPTLSHHMKVLTECGLVISKKEGKWMHYKLNVEKIECFQKFITNLTSIK